MTSSIVIVSYRPHRWLRRSVDSAVAEADEVVVVDNGSGGDVAALVGDAGARIVRLPRNVGFPGGVNAGVAATTGDLVALLNDDAFAEPGWLASATATLADERVGAVTPKLVFALPFAELRFDDEGRTVGSDPRRLGRALRSVTLDGSELLPRLLGPGVHRLEEGVLDGVAGPWRWTTGREPIYVPLPDEDTDPAELVVDGAPAPVTGLVRIINSAGAYLSAHGYGGDFGYGSPDDGAFDEPAERFGACGAAVVTRRSTWDRTGGMAAGFFAYYEDLDWSWRLRLAGLAVRYDPAGTVRHVGGVTSGGPLADEVQGRAERNRLLCLARNAPLPVLAGEVRRTWPPARSTASALPGALLDRRRLRRSWRVDPGVVWSAWAGRDERWPSSAPS